MQTTKRSPRLAHVLTTLVAAIGLIVPMGLQTAQGAEPTKVPLTLVSTHSHETSDGNLLPSKMIDGNTGTNFHTPYSQTIERPYNIDFALGDAPIELDRLVMTPPQGTTGTGASNGRIGEYEIFAGDSLDALVSSATGTWADDDSPKTVDLSGTAQFVRLSVKTTYGAAYVSDEWPAQNNKFVAIAELEIFGTEPVVEPEPDPEPQYDLRPIGETDAAFLVGDHGKVRVNKVLDAKSTYEVGDVLSLQYRYESLLRNVNHTLAVTSDTVTGLTVCQRTNIPSVQGERFNCGDDQQAPFKGPINYTITEDDAAAGKATIVTEWAATNLSTNQTQTLVHGFEVPVASVVPTPTPTEDPEPTEPRPEGVYVALASAGDWGFSCHRIPALTTTKDGSAILAAWDGRPGCADSPNHNSILQSISTDGGQTWSDAVNIAAGYAGDAGNQQATKWGYSDPSYVTDRETGEIFLFFLKSYEQGFHGSQPGIDPNNRQIQHAAVISSTDNGSTWSEPEVITEALTGDVATWKGRFASSGEGIQLRYGDHAGRLIQQYVVSLTTGGGYRAVSLYSDDNGQTWQPGELTDAGMDENKVVELSDGTVMLNSRTSDGQRARRIALSTDGGETWGPSHIDNALPDPVNNAAIIRAYPNAPKGSADAKILLFTNANSTSGRQNGHVRISYDDGQTWATSRQFQDGAMSYSTITALPEAGTYGILYEGANNQIRYMTISHDWIDPVRASISATPQPLNRGANEIDILLRNHGTEAVTLTPSVSGPSYLTFSELETVTVQPGQTVTLPLTVTVSAAADPGAVALSFTASNDDGETAFSGQFPIQLLPGQNPSAAIPGIELVNEVPSQTGEGIERAFDGNTATNWHTAYGTGVPAVTLPLDIDIQLGDEPVDATWFQYVPRQQGLNGTIGGYELWAGDAIDALEMVEEGVWAASNATKSVLLDDSYQFVRLRILSTYGDTLNQWASAAEFRVTQAVADTPPAEAELIDVDLVNELEHQSTGGPTGNGFPASNMFDGDRGTWFHSPWGNQNAVDFPYNIDLSLGDDPVALDRFVLVPHVGQGDGEANGRPGAYRILVGDSLDDLTVAAEGTWPNNAEDKVIDLTGNTAKFLRLEIGGTYGAPASTFVAIREIEVYGTTADVEEEPMIGLVLTRTDNLGSPVDVGDRLTFDISYTNNTDQALTAFPRAGTIDGGFFPPTVPNCRYANLGAGATNTCTTAFHIVTQADLEAGSFTPEVVFDATSDREGLTVLEAGITASLPAIAVGEEVEPTEEPTEEPTGEPVPTTTVTVTSTATATVTSTATATETAPTVTTTATTTATATATATVTEPTVTETVTADPTDSKPATSKPAGPSSPQPGPIVNAEDIYVTPGKHDFNGRQWFTTCEPYSQTWRCRTDIWASTVQVVDGTPKWVTGWTFNNLTYLPMAREAWTSNPLGYSGSWTSDEGRQWKTECDTAATGSNACRSYIWMDVWQPTAQGATTFHKQPQWVFNNIVHFTK